MIPKQTITVTQSKQKSSVKVGVNKSEQQYTYTVVQLQGTTEPAIGESLSKKQVDDLCRQPNTVVNIKPRKQSFLVR